MTAAFLQSAVALVSPHGEIVPAGKLCLPQGVSSFLSSFEFFNSFEVFEKFENSYFARLAFYHK